MIKPILEIKSKKGSETKKESFKINELNDLIFPNLKNLEIIKNVVNLKINSKIIPLNIENVRNADCIIITTDHDNYKQFLCMICRINYV